MSDKLVNKVAEIPRPSPEFPRKNMPQEIDFSSFANIEPLIKQLLEKPLNSAEDVEQWLLETSEFSMVIGEETTRRSIAMTCHTDDEEAEKAYLHMIENIIPHLKPLSNKIAEKLVNCPYTDQLDKHRYEVLIRSAKNAIELFREENIPIQTEIDKLSQQYQKLNGAMTVEFKGREHTMQQMAMYYEDTDRDLRKAAFETSFSRRLQDKDKMEDIFDEMLKLRQQVAKNAGFENYRDYMFREMERFDYTPQHCYDYHDAVEKIIVPMLKNQTAERKDLMKLDTVRPYDTGCDPLGRDPLRPFADVETLAFGCRNIFMKVDEELGGYFQQMIDRGLLDLDSRKGKAPGGYQTFLSENRLPFIFMNAVGMNSDLFTLLHEGGHSFHSWLARHEPLNQYQHAPMEFCEVASMAMEHIALPYITEFYNEKEHARAARSHLQGDISVLSWVATIDAFQHWIYTNPGHTRDERAEYWTSLTERFSSGIDHSGYEEALKYRWHAQLHIFEVPFYYIEYGIALLGALQIWKNSLEDPKKALDSYKKALSMGGSRPLTELFEAAGIKFDFTADTISPLMEKVGEESEKLKSLEM